MASILIDVQSSAQGADTLITIPEEDVSKMSGDDSQRTSESSDEFSDDALHVLTLNCWGIPLLSKDYESRMNAIAAELKKGHYAIVALQEIWIKSDYHKIKNEVKDVLPYSHYFHSGHVGSGMCVFSRYPLVDAFFNKYPQNGYFYAVTHGDFFGGKGVGYLKIKHPEKTIMFFNTHLHAGYIGSDYHTLRTLQAYNLCQFVRLLTKPDDYVIVCGDFNHEDSELGMRSILELTGLKDSWCSCLKRGSRHGSTVNVNDNPYSKENGEPEMRIDFILHSANLQSIKCGLAIEKVPESTIHYSDHKGVASAFQFCDSPAAKDGRLPVSREILEEIRDVMTQAIGALERSSWKKALIFWLVLLLFVFMPVLSANLFHTVFPQVETHLGKLTFLMQIIAVVFGVGFFWASVIETRSEKAAYLNVKSEVDLKLAAIKID